MEILNKKYVVQMEVLTPLHVGAGAEKDWVQGSDFVVHEGKVKILNLHKVSKYINTDDLTAALLNKDGELLIKKLGSNLDNCIDKVFDGFYAGSNDIKTCIKNGLSDKPIVPGSSLKGAIRSVFVDYLIDDFSRKKLKCNENDLFGKASVGDEFMRFVKIADACFETTNLVNTKIFNLRSTSEGGWKHGANNTTSKFMETGFNTIYEVIEPGEKSIMSISIADVAFKNYADKITQFSTKKVNLINNNVSFLFSIINDHTKMYLEKEKAFFTKYATEKSDMIIESIEMLIKQLPENGEYCILKMAAGSGFHSITGDWQFDNYSIDRVYSEFTDKRTGQIKQKSRGHSKVDGKFIESAKSRKIAIQIGDKFSLMGFVKLRPISEQEIQQAEEFRRQRQLEIDNELKAKVELIEKQRRIEIEKLEELHQRIALYNKLITEASDLLQKGNLDEAITCVQNAEINSPEGVAHFELKSQIEKAINIRKQEDDALKAQQALEQARIASNKIPLSEKIDRLDKYPTIFNGLKTWMKLNEVQNLDDADINLLVEKLSALYSIMKPNDKKQWADYKKWSDLAKVIGEDTAKRVFNKIIS